MILTDAQRREFERIEDGGEVQGLTHRVEQLLLAERSLLVEAIVKIAEASGVKRQGVGSLTGPLALDLAGHVADRVVYLRAACDEGRPMSASIADRLDAYLAARGMSYPDMSDCIAKVREEADELAAACFGYFQATDSNPIMHEVADVVLAAAVVAHEFGFTVEDAIAAKTALDEGRERTRSHLVQGVAPGEHHVLCDHPVGPHSKWCRHNEGERGS